MNSKLACTLACLALTGCATAFTPITQAGGTYFVASKQTWGMKDWSTLQAETLQKAAAFCAQQGKDMRQIDVRTHGEMGWSPQETGLTFRCVDRQ